MIINFNGVNFIVLIFFSLRLGIKLRIDTESDRRYVENFGLGVRDNLVQIW